MMSERGLKTMRDSLREGTPERVTCMKTEDQMSPCFRGCGAFVPTNGPAVCGACQVGPEPPDPALHTTERKVGSFVVRTLGHAVVFESPAATGHGEKGRMMFSFEARRLSEALQNAADYVEAMTSPYATPERVPVRRSSAVDDPYADRDEEQPA